MQVIKLGQYRIGLIIVSSILIAVAGITQHPLVFLALGVIGFGWLMMEINVVLRTALALQQMIVYLIAPPENKQTGKMKETLVKSIDINTGEENEEASKKI